MEHEYVIIDIRRRIASSTNPSTILTYVSLSWHSRWKENVESIVYACLVMSVHSELAVVRHICLLRLTGLEYFKFSAKLETEVRGQNPPFPPPPSTSLPPVVRPYNSLLLHLTQCSPPCFPVCFTILTNFIRIPLLIPFRLNKLLLKPSTPSAHHSPPLPSRLSLLNNTLVGPSPTTRQCWLSIPFAYHLCSCWSG